MKTHIVCTELMGISGPYAEWISSARGQPCFCFELLPDKQSGLPAELQVSGSIRLFAYGALAEQLHLHLKSGMRMAVTSDLLLGADADTGIGLLCAVATDVLLLSG